MTTAIVPELVVVGDADIDLYVRSARVPGPGEKVLGRLLGLHAGGMAANVACTAVRLGRPAALVTRLGDDDLGRIALRYYAEIGLDARGVEVVPEVSTYVGIVTLDPDGEKSLVVADGGALFPSRDWLAGVDLTRSRAVHLVPFDMVGAATAAVRADGAGVLVSVDLEPTMLDSSAAADVAALLGAADVLFCPHFTALRYGATAAAGARALLAAGPRVVVTTLGADGALVTTPDGETAVPAVPVQVVDTSGAGDGFAAGFLHATLDGAEPVAAARYAATVAAQVVGSLGGSQGVVREAGR